jgi:DNA-binding transcriptional MerR regulator
MSSYAEAAEAAEEVESDGAARTDRAAGTDGARYRIDELARRTGISVRNIREYQDRGLLSAPVRTGRIAWYEEPHVVRLQLIARLLERGYTIAVIRDLLEAWTAGRDLGDVLGFDAVVSKPWTDELPVRLSLLQLRRMLGRQLTVPAIRRAMRLGILEPVGLRAFDVTSPALLQAAVDLRAAGVSITTVLDVVERVQTDLDRPADRLVEMVFRAVLPEDAQAGLPLGEDLRLATETIDGLRPHAQRAVHALFATSLQRAVDRRYDILTERATGTTAAASAPGVTVPQP